MSTSSLHPLLAALESTQVTTWDVNMDTVALHLRALLVREGIGYEDLGRRTGFGMTMEAFALIGVDLSLILFHGARGRTAIALGEGLRTPRGLGKRIIGLLDEKLKTRGEGEGGSPDRGKSSSNVK